jgi:hypothetical protein
VLDSEEGEGEGEEEVKSVPDGAVKESVMMVNGGATDGDDTGGGKIQAQLIHCLSACGYMEGQLNEYTMLRLRLSTKKR